jgi:tetratricopeptide (TPR) repeat protein
MSLLYGLGIGFLLLKIQQKKSGLLLPSGIVIVVLCGAVPLFANYKEHNRGNLWVPWDYAYNLLMSCEPNAILFTNGDNDTFPLWFAQEVAGIRKDVRVVNLSLGNTDWYIKQMLENEPILKLSYDKAGIDREMVLSEKNYEQPSQRIEFWVNKAEQAIPTLSRQIEILETRLDSTESVSEVAKINADLQKRRVWLQTYTGLKDWGESRRNGIMQTQHKLVVDLTMNNMDKPIHVSTTVGLSNAIGLDKYMVQKGMIWDLAKGNLTPSKDSMDIEKTAFLVDSVFKFRGLGDSTTYINRETEQLLFNYNSIYIRLATTMRDFNRGISYLDKGIKQFPGEWRNYVVASELLQQAGENARAAEYLEKGLKVMPASVRDRYLKQFEAFEKQE